jgi:hypothetical protein
MSGKRVTVVTSRFVEAISAGVGLRPPLGHFSEIASLVNVRFAPEPDLPSESGFDPNADMSRSVSTRLQFLAQSESAVAFVGPGDLAWC